MHMQKSNIYKVGDKGGSILSVFDVLWQDSPAQETAVLYGFNKEKKVHSVRPVLHQQGIVIRLGSVLSEKRAVGVVWTLAAKGVKIHG